MIRTKTHSHTVSMQLINADHFRSMPNTLIRSNTGPIQSNALHVHTQMVLRRIIIETSTDTNNQKCILDQWNWFDAKMDRNEYFLLQTIGRPFGSENDMVLLSNEPKYANEING